MRPKEVTNKEIKDWFAENYGHLLEYDGIKIERIDNSGKGYPNEKHMEIISFGRVVGQFQGFCDTKEKYFSKGKTHLDWVFK